MSVVNNASTSWLFEVEGMLLRDGRDDLFGAFDFARRHVAAITPWKSAPLVRESTVGEAASGKLADKRTLSTASNAQL